MKIKRIHPSGKVEEMTPAQLQNHLSTGTSYKGRIDTTYSRLVEVFGQPTITGSLDNKIDAEWIVLTMEGIATIYNWKDGKSYLGETGKLTEEIRDWHIGGHTGRVIDYILRALKI